LQSPQHVHGRFAQKQRLTSGLAVGESDDAAIPVHPRPLGGQDLVEPGAGEQEKLNGRNHVRRFGLRGETLPQRLAESGELVARQVAFTVQLGKLLYMATRVGVVGTHPPQFRKVEQLREKGQGSIGLVGRLGQMMVQAHDVVARDVVHLPSREPGPNDVAPLLSVVALRQWLLPWEVVGFVARPQIRNGRSSSRGELTGLRILAASNGGQCLCRQRSRLIRGDGAVCSQSQPTLLRRASACACPVLDYVAALPGGQHLYPEAWQLVIPKEYRFAGGRLSLNGSLGDPGGGHGFLATVVAGKGTVHRDRGYSNHVATTIARAEWELDVLGSIFISAN